MFGKNQAFEYGDMDLGPLQDAVNRRSRQNSVEAAGRGQRTSAKKRSSRKRTGQAIMGISHRRNHKWSW